MNQQRIRILNNNREGISHSVVYVMSRDQRVEDNFALLYAQETAEKLNLPLIVIFNLYQSVRNRTINHYEWMLTGLEEVRDSFKKLNIDFYITVNKSPEELARQIDKILIPNSVFFDFSPLKGPRYFKERFVAETDSTCVLVDTHNIVPVWVTSNKEEFGAYTIRPKIKRLLKDYLEEPKPLKKAKLKLDTTLPKDFILNFELSDLLKEIKGESIKNYTPVVEPGTRSAHLVLKNFISNKLINYYSLRNNPNFDAQSDLSAYLHFGNISSLRIALEVLNHCHKAGVKVEFGFKEEVKDFDKLTDKQKLKLSAEAFLEELIVRKELADNFCYYNYNYDSFNGIKQWARTTLSNHLQDTRDHIYSLKELKESLTSDPAWNAAQNQLIKTGKIHGYMRMYWAKRILEWTKTPVEAIEYLVYLNDKYSLDGYDANGYAGILWSVGGLHDRAWFDRPIFGQIRYMNSNGLAKKFDIKKYINEWS